MVFKILFWNVPSSSCSETVWKAMWCPCGAGRKFKNLPLQQVLKYLLIFFSPLSFRKYFKDGRIPLGRVPGSDVPSELRVSELIRSQDEGMGRGGNGSDPIIPVFQGPQSFNHTHGVVSTVGYSEDLTFSRIQNKFQCFLHRWGEVKSSWYHMKQKECHTAGVK